MKGGKEVEEKILQELHEIKEVLRDIRSILEPKEMTVELSVDREISEEDTYNLIVENSQLRQIN